MYSLITDELFNYISMQAQGLFVLFLNNGFIVFDLRHRAQTISRQNVPKKQSRLDNMEK